LISTFGGLVNEAITRGHNMCDRRAHQLHQHRREKMDRYHRKKGTKIIFIDATVPAIEFENVLF